MRVTRTFGFVDLSGFTSFTESYGDSEAVDVLAEFRGCIRRIASDRGVRVDKWLGDGAMFVGVDATEVIDTMLEIGRSWGGWPMALRGGVATGEVILFEGDDYIGSPVNLAARLCDIASPGELLVPVGTEVSAPTIGTGPVAVPGFVRPVEVGHYALDGRELKLVSEG